MQNRFLLVTGNSLLSVSYLKTHLISSQRGKEKTYQMKSNTNIIKPDQAARLDILINHQLFKPKYSLKNLKSTKRFI